MTPYRLSESERQTARRFAALALPRHTSYPAAPAWRAYGAEEFREDLRRSARQRRPLSLYIHVPFCERLCWYCACTKEIVPPGKHAAHDPGDAFLDGLEVEANSFAELAGAEEVRQLHLGGGTPTFLRTDQLQRLGAILQRRFRFARDAELALEIDPRVTTREQLAWLRSFGFNRVSLGIQDFSERVQRAVNRIQPLEVVQHVLAWCRSLRFDSINFDLIYGLPFQTLNSMADTLEKTISLAPDRIAFYRLAVLPEIFRWQNVFKSADLPAGDLPLEMNLLAINRFRQAGYEFIGLDHFARPDEGLAQAARDGSLRRNFQGMTTGKGLDVLALGPSAVSQLDDAFAQNPKTTGEWRTALVRGLATERGLRLTEDDRLRRELLQSLYGYGAVDKRLLEDRFGIVFDDYFADELFRLAELQDEGLLVLEPDRLQLTVPLGRLLVRIVAAVFDRYLPRNAYRDGLLESHASKVG